MQYRMIKMSAGIHLPAAVAALAVTGTSSGTVQTTQCLLPSIPLDTFGALFATAMMRGGAVVKDREDVGAADVAEIGRAALQGLMDRGKASLGDKTLLDALAPAIDAFDGAHRSGKSLREATDAAVAACEAGTKATTPMQSKVSRASWLGERSIGVQDPGATAVLFMLKATQSWVHANS